MPGWGRLTIINVCEVSGAIVKVDIHDVVSSLDLLAFRVARLLWFAVLLSWGFTLPSVKCGLNECTQVIEQGGIIHRQMKV